MFIVKRLKFLKKGLPVFPAFIVGLFISVAIFGDSIAPYPADLISLPDKFTPPFFQAGGSLAHPLGTDELGRDVLSRILAGARPSLIVALAVIILGGLGGTAIGIISGYYGGKVDVLVMRAVDVSLTFPMILVGMLLAVILGPSLQTVVIAISLVLWSRYARVIRGEVLSVKEQDFVALARVAGASGPRIMLRHIFPNVTHTMLIMLTLQLGLIIIIEATLSFLGAGIPPPIPVWGRMMASGRDYLTSAWWVTTFPGIALSLVVLSFNMIGDWVREVIDPKLRQV